MRHDPGPSAASPQTATTPAALGYRMPAEWHEHAATHTSWPFDDELWEGHLEGVRDEFARLVATVARFEPVELNVRDAEAEQDARRRVAAAAEHLYPREAAALLARVTYVPLPLNDVWFRDNGPLFVKHAERGDVALTDWGFNAWGRKYEPWALDDQAPEAVARRLGMRRFEVPIVMEGGALELNDRGVLLTTRSCLLEPNRNPHLDETQLEAYLKDNLGATEVVWLESGLEGDHTDGHIDTIVRFADDDTIVCAVEDDEDDPNHASMARNLEQLKRLRKPDGQPYRVVELPLPQRRMELNGQRLPATYANFYLGNGFVVVPTYDDANDEQALEVLRPLFPGREVIGLPAVSLITGGGAFHCVTQQRPAGAIARGDDE